MRTLRVFAVLTAFIIVILLWLFTPGIGGKKKVTIQKQFIKSVTSGDLPENYSIYLSKQNTSYILFLIKEVS